MSKEWIGQLAAEIKEKDREAASAYGLQQHRLEIMQAQGHGFFAAVAAELEGNFAEIKAELQGDVTACETSIERDGGRQVMLSRSRFPWFDAVLRYEQETMVLDYAQGKGVGGAVQTTAERRVTVFPFTVTEEDRLLVEEGLGEQPRRYREPEELARRIMEMLFAA
jgi:hypothetical protein